MVHAYEIDGLQVKTGDLICSSDGDTGSITGRFWRIIGTLIPGDVDHIVIYVGPGGRCVEAGARGKVVSFSVRDNHWDAAAMEEERGPFIDRFYGVAYPLAERNLTREREEALRNRVADYCIEQSRQEKPYNLNFFDPSTDEAFYCSQLAYKAYLTVGIDLHAHHVAADIPGADDIVFPQEIWDRCAHARYTVIRPSCDHGS